MSTGRQYHFETLAFVLLISVNASGGVSASKPQVVQGGGPVSGAAAKPAAETTPVAPRPGATNAVGAPPGTGIIYPYPGRPPGLATLPGSNDPPKDEQSALSRAAGVGNALTQLMGSSTGGGFMNSRDIADPSGDAGIDYSSSENSTPVSPSELNSPRRITLPFRKWFEHCTKEKLGFGDCRFVNLGIMGDASHRARRSCHNSGEAIDVGTVTCSSGRKFAPSSDEFLKLADCMANDSNNELEVIFHKSTGGNMIQKSDHAGHMHIQLKNCRMVYGQ